jgi:hypothetical protein
MKRSLNSPTIPVQIAHVIANADFFDRFVNNTISVSPSRVFSGFH